MPHDMSVRSISSCRNAAHGSRETPYEDGATGIGPHKMYKMPLFVQFPRRIFQFNSHKDFYLSLGLFNLGCEHDNSVRILRMTEMGHMTLIESTAEQALVRR